MQIKAAKELQIALISVWHTTPKRWPCFVSTDMRKLVIDRKSSALIQTQIRQLSGHRSTNIFVPITYVFVYLCRLNLQTNCGLHPSQFDTRHRNVDLALSALLCENVILIMMS